VNPEAEFRVIGDADELMLCEIFAHLDQAFFRPHPFTADEARRIAHHRGRDTYAVLVEAGRPVAYGMLRGWDEGYDSPSLGVAVRTDAQGRGLGRLMMVRLHDLARARGSDEVRLRVHPDNRRARRLYESLGYSYGGEERDELVMKLRLGSNSACG
jgi:ribosomal protein S18 acetylase RimI-like enzyme